MTTQHAPLEGTIESIYNGDAREATCTNCGQTIVEWNYRDNDGDRSWHIYEPWAIEVEIPTSPTSRRIQKVTTCTAA